MFAHFREDLAAHREGLLAQGFWALQIHRFGAARKRIKWKLLRKFLGMIHLVLSKSSQIFFGIYIGSNAKIGSRCTIEHFGSIIIHSNAEIGDDVIIRHEVTIGNRYLDRPLDVPVIGNRVNIGAGAKILGKIKIGNGASIGANAVVLVDVPEGYTAAGVPARVWRPSDATAE